MLDCERCFEGRQYVCHTAWKARPKSQFKGFSLLLEHCHCCGPRHRMCSVRVGKFALSSEHRNMESRLAVGLMDTSFYLFCIRFC